MKNLKKTRIMLIWMAAACLAAGCVIGPEGVDEESVSNDNTTSWADDLTIEQAVSAMLVTVDSVQDESSEIVVNNGVATTSSALTEDDQAVKVEWNLPVLMACEIANFYGANFDCTGKYFDLINWKWKEIWKISTSSDGISWETVNEDIDVVEETDGYKFSVRHKCKSGTQFINYFKVALPDSNGSNPAESIVTFFVYPKDSDLVVTLSEETSAKAPSSLFAGYNYLSGWEWYPLWENINDEVLPASQSMIGNLPPWTPVIFKIDTDFSDYDFGPGLERVIHKSNSSFCKVTMVEDETQIPEGVAWRLMFKFEDLPIDRVSLEPEKKFDYNDVVIYVDIMKR